MLDTGLDWMFILECWSSLASKGHFQQLGQNLIERRCSIRFSNGSQSRE
jgi:hypothetical protein